MNNPNVAKLAASIVADPRYADLKISAYEAIPYLDGKDESFQHGFMRGKIEFFSLLLEWSKDVEPSKLKAAKAQKEDPTTQNGYVDPDLK